MSNVMWCFLQDKLKLRLKTLEEGLKQFSSHPTNSNAFSGSPKAEKFSILGFLTTSGGRKRSTSQPRASTVGSSLFQQPNIKNINTENVAGLLTPGSPARKKYSSTENMLKKGIWASRSKVADGGEKENEIQVNTDMKLNRCNDEREAGQKLGTLLRWMTTPKARYQMILAVKMWSQVFYMKSFKKRSSI